MGSAAQARAADPADYLALAHPITLLNVELAEMAVEGAAPRPVVFDLNRQAIATRQATAHHQAAQG